MELRAFLLAGILFFVASNVFAEPVLETSEGGVRIVLYTDPCALKEISNLPYKAVWHENGKEVSGCWSAHPPLGVVVMYFASDKTVGLAPMQSFRRVIGI